MKNHLREPNILYLLKDLMVKLYEIPLNYGFWFKNIIKLYNVSKNALELSKYIENVLAYSKLLKCFISLHTLLSKGFLI